MRYLTFSKLLVLGTAFALLMLGPVTGPSAQQVDVTWDIDDATVAIDKQVTVDIEVSESSTPAGAMQASLTYDATKLEFTSCSPVVTYAACHSPEAGTVNVASVTDTSWAEGTVLAQITFTGLAADYTGSLDLASDEWLSEVGADLTSGLRGAGLVVALSGDTNCTEATDIVDALFIAQFTVGNRAEAASCPMGDPAGEINTGAADTNGDGLVNIVDALMISQCSVEISNVFCPAQ